MREVAYNSENYFRDHDKDKIKAQGQGEVPFLDQEASTGQLHQPLMNCLGCQITGIDAARTFIAIHHIDVSQPMLVDQEAAV